MSLRADSGQAGATQRVPVEQGRPPGRWAARADASGVVVAANSVVTLASFTRVGAGFIPFVLWYVDTALATGTPVQNTFMIGSIVLIFAGQARIVIAKAPGTAAAAYTVLVQNRWQDPGDIPITIDWALWEFNV